MPLVQCSVAEVLYQLETEFLAKTRFLLTDQPVNDFCRRVLGSVDISREPYKSGDKAEKSKITDS